MSKAEEEQEKSDKDTWKMQPDAIKSTWLGVQVAGLEPALPWALGKSGPLGKLRTTAGDWFLFILKPFGLKLYQGVIPKSKTAQEFSTARELLKILFCYKLRKSDGSCHHADGSGEFCLTSDSLHRTKPWHLTSLPVLEGSLLLILSQARSSTHAVPELHGVLKSICSTKWNSWK